MKIACCIFSFNITKGMKSYGPIGTLKKNNTSKELILHQIEYLRKIFGSIDIYVVLGFGQEKITNSVRNKKNINFIYNNDYDKKNYAYAFKLFLQNIKGKIDNYDGVLFIDSNVLIRHLSYKNTSFSWIVAKKTKKNMTNYLGIRTSDISDTADMIFYQLGKLVWCKSFYLSQKDIKTCMIHAHKYYDNMFIFEILNESIDKLGIKFKINETSYSDSVEINGIKDKAKII
jgi:hypothetical protein